MDVVIGFFYGFSWLGFSGRSLELEGEDGSVPRSGVMVLLLGYFGMNLDVEGTEFR